MAKNAVKTAEVVKLPKKKFAVEVSFKVAKETEGTFQYKEVDSDGDFLNFKDAVIGGLYIRKSALGKDAKAPKTLTVKVSAD